MTTTRVSSGDLPTADRSVKNNRMSLDTLGGLSSSFCPINNTAGAINDRDARPTFPLVVERTAILLAVARSSRHDPDRSRRRRAIGPLCLESLSLARRGLAGEQHHKAGGFEFSKPLSSDQLAPVGFLVLERLVIRLIGGSDRALRLIPLFSGIVSLFLMRSVVRRLLKPRAAILALAIFALADDLTYYSSEIKQYSSDVAIALGLLLYVFVFDNSRARSCATFALLGCLAVWFSFPVVYVLAGAGSTLIVQSLSRRDQRASLAMIGVAIAWSASFAASYLFLSRIMVSKYTGLWIFWGFAFPSRPFAFGASLNWLIRIFLNIFINPLGFNMPLGPWCSIVLPAGLFAIGCVALARENIAHLGLLLGPIIFAIAAGAARLYPFYGRLALWIAPFVLFDRRERSRGDRRRQRRAFGIATGLLLCFPLMYALLHLFSPRDRTDFNSRGDLRKDAIVLRGAS